MQYCRALIDIGNMHIRADVWVARDLSGHRLDWNVPYVSDAFGGSRVRTGLPTPVQCCWNGMARIDAAPFLAGLRFRTHLEGECMASECSLVCDDLWRMGPEALGGRSARILMDPSGEWRHKAAAEGVAMQTASMVFSMWMRLCV